MDMILNPLIIVVGIVIGILVAAPVGPVNVLCIQRSLSRGMFAGVVAGLGAVLGDGLIAFSAALGVGFVTDLVTHYRSAIQVVGGIVLAVFGLQLYRRKPAESAIEVAGNGKRMLSASVWDIPKTFFLTVTNPGAVLGLFAIFGGISTFVEVRGPGEALLTVASIMLGSFAWWVFLSYLVGRIRHKFDMTGLKRIDQIAGVLLVMFGVVLLGEIVLKQFGLA